MTFRIGQEVCCIREMSQKGRELFLAYGGDPQVVGTVYTISDICPDEVFPEKPVVLLLKGMKTARMNGIRLGWEPEDFRPVVKTDIEIFHKMLAPKPELVSQ